MFLWPCFVSLERGTARFPCVAERRCPRLTDADRLGKVGLCILIQTFVDRHTHFILNSLLNRLSMQLIPTSAYTVQDRCPGLSMSGRPSTVVLVRRLPACLWLPTAPSPVILIRFTVVCRSTCTQHVWWPVLCHCRAAGLDSGTLRAELQQCSSLRQFKRCLKTFLFRSWWDYGALWLFCIEIALFTYLLIKQLDRHQWKRARYKKYTLHAYTPEAVPQARCMT